MNPVLLLILDGWGYRTDSDHNAIAQAKTPTWDKWWQGPHTLLSASGEDVGLPEGQMGNSEVGHLNLGAGRIVWQDYTRITQSIADGQLSAQPGFKTLIDATTKNNGALHILGLVSDGGVHSHVDHIIGLIEQAHKEGVNHIFVHAFLDGRDTPPKSAAPHLERISACLQRLSCGRIASITGRYWAMDRDQRWERTEKAYRLITEAHSEVPEAKTPIAALENAYARGETDEFVLPTVIVTDDSPACIIQPGDGVIFANFRADRARQLSHALTAPEFTGFVRKRLELSCFASMTMYDEKLNSTILFSPEPLSNGLGEVLAKAGKRQLRVAETEKYAHVTFFFNGGEEAPNKNEERQLIPSPKVATYDMQPQMSAEAVCDALISAMTTAKADVIIANFANADMVGHTGNLEATIAAIESLDACFARLDIALMQTGAQMLVTADHGNAECLYNPDTNQAHTAHTIEPVPLVYVGPQHVTFKKEGRLSDVAPSLLALLDIPVPSEMTGEVLLEIEPSSCT